MNSYKDLIVWQRSFELAKEIYRLTSKFPNSEVYGLTSQLRRASISIISNLAEGFSRKSWKENKQFLSIAFGSSSEIETQLLLAKELGFAPDNEFNRSEGLLLEVRKMLNTMLRGVSAKS
ncbi:MAG TPA: four helix bundle protein [Candidatus Paceibacterota bacterium]|nr:four helix bundle protein [Candidatus Paceibacterota bacterium]